MATRSRSVSAEKACCKTSPHVPRSDARGKLSGRARRAAEVIMDVVVDGLTFPEAPRWRDGKLWFSDFYTQRVLTVDPRGTLETVVEVPQRPSGLGWTPDGRTLIVAETLAHRLTAFDIAADGALSNRRLFAALDSCFPDGICLDAEGAVWVADARTPRVLRVLDGGRIERTIPTGARFAFACMLGAQDRRTLYLCTSTGSGPAMADKRDGAIESVRVDVPGAGLP